ncbi:hypothetical protein SCUP234_06007 [Seiridium cupressi]
MKLCHLLALSSSALVVAEYPSWHPPGPGDARGPCPMLNALANHGLLPHDGKDYTHDLIVSTFNATLNIEETVAAFSFQQALTTNPIANATTFSLTDLRNHNILEHDASLSRADFYWGNDYAFNQTVFDETRSYWTNNTVNPLMAASARLARISTYNATNPAFNMTETGQSFSLGETAAYMVVLGDRASSTANRAWVEYFFENERLPVELGWSRPEQPVDFPTMTEMMAKVANETTNDPVLAARLKGRGGMHVGIDLGAGTSSM